ncbi:MAG: hypothetical protein ABIR56_03245 [Polaromonas sp.]
MHQKSNVRSFISMSGLGAMSAVLMLVFKDSVKNESFRPTRTV